MNWTVHIRKKALKLLGKIPRNDQERIKSALREMTDNPYVGDIEKIEGEENTWRRRSGNYRILFDIDVNNKFVEVRMIKRRTSSTYL